MKGIPMKTWEVRAILDGRKTVTRRVVKPQPVSKSQIIAAQKDNGTWFWWSGGVKKNEMKPPCIPGDILYVRETWNYGYCDTTDFECQCNETFFEELKPGSMKDSFLFPRYFYRTEDLDGIVGMKWHPSIHMPRDAARIFLRVKDVGVERLQDMNMEDIQAEGVVPDDVKGGQWQQWQRDYMKPVWDSTIKPKDRDIYGWEANPWTWAIEFEKISKEEAIK